MERVITFEDIKTQISVKSKELGLADGAKHYGVPRGGMYIAAMLNPVSTPCEAHIIVDDLIDSGATRDKWQKLYPHKPFVALFDKTDEWLRFPWEKEGAQDIEDNILRILQYFEPKTSTREGLKETPKRFIKFMTEFLKPKEFNFTTFASEGADEMIVQKHIPFYSLCEHHLLPFFGLAHVAYIPKGKIIGLSKLARCVDLYANRFQNQERITTQVAERLSEELATPDVAVILSAKHMCMEMRGVKKHDTWTTTSKMMGVFKDNAIARNEFLKLIA